MIQYKKSAGIDGILNEYIKCTSIILLDVYVKLFNEVLQTDHILQSWFKYIIVPIFENKADTRYADNYCGVTLVRCIGNVFTCLLNERIVKYLNDGHILNENQAGFRKHYSTNDHVFVSQIFIDLFPWKNKYNKYNMWHLYIALFSKIAALRRFTIFKTNYIRYL